MTLQKFTEGPVVLVISENLSDTWVGVHQDVEVAKNALHDFVIDHWVEFNIPGDPTEFQRDPMINVFFKDWAGGKKYRYKLIDMRQRVIRQEIGYASVQSGCVLVSDPKLIDSYWQESTGKPEYVLMSESTWQDHHVNNLDELVPGESYTYRDAWNSGKFTLRTAREHGEYNLSDALSISRDGGDGELFLSDVHHEPTSSYVLGISPDAQCRIVQVVDEDTFERVKVELWFKDPDPNLVKITVLEENE